MRKPAKKPLPSKAITSIYRAAIARAQIETVEALEALSSVDTGDAELIRRLDRRLADATYRRDVFAAELRWVDSTT